MGTQQRNAFTPVGFFQKIKLPWSKLDVPWPRPETHGEIDIDKLEANFEALRTQLDSNSLYLNRTDWGNVQGTRWATIVIAAADSIAINKQSADYVCTGSGDQTIIQTALTALLALRGNTTGIGRLVFLEGTYTISSSITMNALGARTIAFVGMGAGGGHESSLGVTRFNNTGSTPVFNISGSSGTAGSNVIYRDIHFAVGTGGGISTRDCPTDVENCTFTGTTGFAFQSDGNTTGTGAVSRFSRNLVSLSSAVASGNGAVTVSAGAGLDRPCFVTENYIKVTGSTNAVYCGNSISTIPSYVVANNYIIGSTAGSGTGINVAGNSAENCTVSGNVLKSIGTGIAMGGYRHTVSGNLAESCGTGFSTGGDSQYLAFLANQATTCSLGFNLGNSAIRPTIVGNKGSANTTAYAVVAGTTFAFIGYNDFGTSGAGTDAGTSTTIVSDLPTGGASQYVLKKNSATTGDYSWALDPAIDAIAGKGSILAGTAVDALTSVTPTKDASLFLSDSAQTAGVKFGRRLFVQNTDPQLSITPDVGDIWIDTT